MLKNLFYKIEAFCSNGQKSRLEEKFFSNIVGYSDIKRLLLKCIVSRDPVSILLTGPPSSSKTVFLLEMLEGLSDAYFVDAFGVSGSGLIEHLFSNNTKYLLVDEIDKMKKNDQAALLNVMETGILSETKLKGKTRQKRMKLSIFATSNDVERLCEPLRSRFIELYLDEYTYDEFIEISCRLLKKKYGLDTNLAEKIGYAVWNQMHSKDIRDVLNIAKLTKSVSDLDWLVGVHMKHGRKKVMS